MNTRPALFPSAAALVVGFACSAPTDTISPALASANDGAGTSAAASVTGTISALSGSCPAVTFTLERKTIKTSTTTKFGAGKCTDLANGLRVTIVGATPTDAGTMATEISFLSTPVVVAAVPAITGAITALTGTCPALTITVSDKSATTSSTTFFDGKGCGDLKVGVQVSIFGTGVLGSSTFVVDKVASPK